MGENEITEADIIQNGGLYHSFYHHSTFSCSDKNALLEKIDSSRKTAAEDLKNADVLLITFGTAYIYKYNHTRKIVSNCHKVPASSFSHYRLQVSEVVEEWNILIKKIKAVNPAVKILFTVSPIRHWKDGAHNNQLSKSVLLLAIEEIMKGNENTYYFPSYEILLDELRDYRFYADDMLHPSELAIRYIWGVFEDTYFDVETKKINKQWQNILRAIHHRPFNPDTPEHKQFLIQTLLKLKELQNNYPNFDCEKEVLSLTNKLSSIK